MFNQPTQSTGYIGGGALGASVPTPSAESPIYQSMSVLSNQLDILEQSVGNISIKLQPISLPIQPSTSNQAKDSDRSRSQLGDAIMSVAQRIAIVNQTLGNIICNLAL